MATDRVHVVIAAEERAAYVAAAEREGLTLSAWLRAAARARLAASRDAPLDSVEELDAFFAACDEREGTRREPDWEEHLAVIAGSRSSGSTA